MLPIFMTTFREGLEALLIISVALAFFRQTGNRALQTPLVSGSAFAREGLVRRTFGLADPAGEHVGVDADFEGDLAATGLRSADQFDGLMLELGAVFLALHVEHYLA